MFSCTLRIKIVGIFCALNDPGRKKLQREKKPQKISGPSAQPVKKNPSSGDEGDGFFLTLKYFLKIFFGGGGDALVGFEQGVLWRRRLKVVHVLDIYPYSVSLYNKHHL